MRHFNLFILRLLFLTNFLQFNSYACFAKKQTNPIQPIVINTWNFKSAGEEAWRVLQKEGSSALDSVQAGCTQCEVDQCDTTVGFGGSPDENGEVRLDSMLMDGTTMNVGAVGSMGRIKQATAIARHVLENTEHTLLVGDLATKFAVSMGYEEETLETTFSDSKWRNWKENQTCQPNFWTSVIPDPKTSCGPYHPKALSFVQNAKESMIDKNFGKSGNHDTIGMIALDKNGHIAAGTSTNGASFKIPGRVGDSPIPGSGAYADSNVGGAAATGDGDIMMRFLPAYLAVELMRNGYPPELAARTAIERITDKYPKFSGAVIALNKEGKVGASCHNLDGPFPFTVGSNIGVQIHYVDCVRSEL